MRIQPFLIAPAALALLLAFFPAAGQSQKKDNKKAQQQKSTKADRIAIDTSKLVWPGPPDIARIKFSNLYTGEKIDFKAIAAAPKKPKQSWMDRLAGSKPVDQQNIKVPFQFIRVFGLAVDSKGNIYAADQSVDAIFIIDPQGDVQLIRNGKEAHFGLINGLAMDDNDRLFVTDSKLHQVVIFNAQHQQEAIIGTADLGDPGGIAIDTENRLLYVVDTGSDQVKVFDADNYKLLRSIGIAGKKHTLTDPGTFSLPTQAALDSDGNLYVTDTLNDRVEIFDADGQFVSAFGKAGDGPGFFARPKGIAVDCDGHIWVVDAVQNRIQVFNREGQLLTYFGEPGPYPGQFNAPYGITIDKKNRVLISEQFPGRVQEFQYITDAEADAAKKKQAEGNRPSGTPEKSPVKDSGAMK
jgi:DNA-binding beta-propeller fold protein YncE